MCVRRAAGANLPLCPPLQARPYASQALGPDYALNVTCKWDETSNTRIKAVPLSEAGSAAAPPPAPSGGKSTPPAHRSMDNGWSNGKSRTPSPSSGSSLGLSSLEEDARQ